MRIGGFMLLRVAPAAAQTAKSNIWHVENYKRYFWDMALGGERL
jgi:hypothetical protein